MISRRNYLAITTVMLVVFFLFQFTNVALENWDGYEENSYYQDRRELPDESSAYKAGSGLSGMEDISENPRDRVVYIGFGNRREREVVWFWANYTKRDFTSYETLDAYEKEETPDRIHGPEMMVINAEDIDWEQKNLCKTLEGYADAGIHLIFCNLPDVQVIKDNVRLQKLLGIEEIKAEKTNVEGIFLRGGFLLGGEAVYKAENKEESDKRQDMELIMPWYTLEAGTQIYMRGITEDLQKQEEDYPAVIWGKRLDRAYVFAVNGGYMEEAAGLGILTAMSSEMKDYDIYPVVNAQCMVITDYPEFASENQVKMEELYGQSMAGMLRDIAWPSILAVYRQNTMGLSCMLTPQYDYEDDSVPSKKELRFYMKRLKEQGAEPGLSGMSVSNTDMHQKLSEDQKIMEEELPDYRFSSFYTGSLTEDEIQTALQEELLSTVRTLVSDHNEECGIIGYHTKDITKQSILFDGTDYTYRDDLRMKSIQTALGYSSVQMDLGRVAYPNGEEDTLEKVISEFSGNISCYWNNFREFSGATVSECDSRIRDFLALDYSDRREGDRIYVERTGPGSSAWFILRVGDERIAHINVDGGSGKQLEDGVWLIEAEDSQVTIELE